MDVVADVIYGMKIKAEIELGAMAASVGISIGLAFVTGGLSALIGAAEIAAMREVVRRIIKEAADQIVDQVMAMVTEPVAAKLEKMVADAVLDLASGAIHPAEGSGGGAGKGVSAMRLNSAEGSAGGGPGGGGGGGAGQMRMDHAEYDRAAGSLGRLSESSLTRLSGSLDRAHNANNRTRGKDPFTQGIDSVVDGATKGMKKAVERIIKHTGETIPKNLRDTSENHKRNEKANEDALKKIMGGQDGKGSPGSPSKGPGGNGGSAGSKPDLLNKALNDPRHHSVEPKNRTCKEDPIDVASGQMLLEQTDLTLPGVLPLALKRTHLSDYTFGTWFGRSWASTLDERIEVDIRNKAIWAREDGTLLVYDRLPTPQQPEVLPLEGPRIPLRRTSEFGAAHMEFATTDPRTGWTKYFTRPRGEGWQLWLTTIEDPNGNQIDIHRDGTGLPLSITHSGGYDVRLTADRDLGRITRLSLSTGPHADDTVQVMAYGYAPASGDLTEVINSSGQPMRFEYDGQGRITAWIDRNDCAYRYVHDTSGRVVETIGPDGYLSGTFVYDTAHGTTRWTDALGHTTRQTFDTRDQLLTRTDPLGRTVTFEYDENGNTTAVTQPDGGRTCIVHNREHRPVEVTLPGGATWRQEYDGFGNCISTTEPTGATTRFSYGALGQLVSVTDALGSTTQVRCDSAGLPLEITDLSGSVTRCERDSFGRPIAVTDPLGATTRLEWTVEGKLSRRILADGSTESWTYDGEGNCTSHTDPLGATSQYEYTHFELLAARTGPDGVRYEFQHNTELRLTKVTDPQGLTWSYAYDPAGRLVAENDFDNRRLTYEYDAAGQLAVTTTASGQTIRFDRDVLGRVVRKDAAGTVTTYMYDATGGLAQASSPEALLTFQRDDFGRLMSETVNGRTLSYTHNALGRRISRTTPTGATSTWTYDASGNRSAVTTAGRTLTFTHDAAGRELTRHLSESLSLTRLYDHLGRLTEQELIGPADQRLQHRAYTYRADGNLTRIDDHLAGTRRFDLDATARVTAVHASNWSESYAYDTAGNQTHATWPDFMPGREATGDRAYTGTCITRAGNVRYEHDAAGRIILRQKTRLSRKPDTWRYTWDAEDRLTSVVTPDGTTWRYRYDPLGRRIAKQRLSADGETVAEQTDFTWDGTTLAEQTTHTPGTAQPAITLTWDHQGLHPLTQTERKTLADAPQEDIDQRFFAIITDLVGTPTELVDEHGNIAWRARTTLWGTTTWNRTATAYTPLRFPGQYHDPETGLHYNYFRHYDPETARYLTPDPLGLTPAPNPAAYVHNPHTWTDPLGLAPRCEDNLVTGYRKQTDHPLSKRIHIGEDGKVTITGKGALYVNLSGDIGHTVRFRGEGGQIVEFNISEEYREKIRRTAVPQMEPGLGFTKAEWKEMKRICPEISDPTMGDDLYGIPSGMLNEFKQEVAKYPGRVVQEG